MASNIEINEQVNKIIELRNAAIELQNKLLKSQAEIYDEIVKKLEKMSENDPSAKSDKLTKSFQDMSKTSKKSLDQLNDSMTDASDNIEDTFSLSEKLKDALGELSAKKVGMLGLKASFAVLLGTVGVGFKIMHSFIGLAKSGFLFAVQATKAIGRFALSVISFPFKILRGIIDLAGSTGGSTELQEAIEGVRKEFGYLNKSAGATILSLSRSMKGELANTGLSVMRVLGNTAAVIRYFTEYAQNLGDVVDAASHSIGEGGAEALVAYNKALGLTANGQKAIAQRAVATGQSINEINRQIANYSIQLSDAFGVTMKAVSRAVGEMMADVSHFGHLAPKELVQVAVYARRLGIDMKNLGQVMDKFINFEDTATAASNLSQAFGLNIDAFKLMQEQDPAKKIEMLRKSFFAAGKSIESMTYQERRLLAQQTGLDDAALQLAFSMKNQGMSYDQVQKKGDAAKKKQLSQAEAMEKLAGAIERLVKAGNFGSGGFFERFLQGFQTGIMWSSEFRKMIRNIRTDLAATYYAGIRLGKALVASFPGVAKIFNGISEIFSPRRFRGMLSGVEATITKFFHDLDFANLLNGLSSVFRNWIGGGGQGAGNIIAGFRAFGSAILKALWSAIQFGMTAITDGLPRFLRAGLDTLKSINWAKIISDAILAKDRIRNAIFSNENIRNFVSGLRELLSNAWTQLKGINLSGLITSVITGMFDNIKIGFNLGKEIIQQVFDGVSSINVGAELEWLWNQLEKGFTDAFNELIPAAESALGDIEVLFSSIYKIISNIDWSKIFTKMGDFVGKLWDKVFGYASDGLTLVISKLPGWADKLLEILQKILQGAISGLSRLFVNIFTPENGRKFVRLLLAVFNLAFNEIPKFLVNMGTRLFSLLTSPETIGALTNALNAAVSFFAGMVDTVLETIGNKLAETFPEYRDTILSVFSGIRRFFTEYYSILRDVFSFVGTGLSTIGGYLGQFLRDPLASIQSAWVNIKNFFRETFEFIANAVTRDLGRVLDIFRQLAGPLMRPFEALMNLVRANHSHSVNTIVGADMQRTVTRVEGAGQQMSTAMNDSFKTMTEASAKAGEAMSKEGVGGGDLARLAEKKLAIQQAADLATSIQQVEKQFMDIQMVSDEKMSNLVSFVSTIERVTTRLQEVQSERLVEVSTKLVKNVNEVATALRTIEPINLEASMKRLANNLGLQELKEITIPQRRINLHVNLNVKMDAEDVETVLVDRPNSRIVALPE